MNSQHIEDIGMNKEEVIKFILGPKIQLEELKEPRVETKINPCLEFELKAFKHYYSITSVSNFFVGSMFELDFEKLELVFDKQQVASISNFKLAVNK